MAEESGCRRTVIYVLAVTADNDNDGKKFIERSFAQRKRLMIKKFR